MFYVRSKNDPSKARPISVRAARWASLAALIGYPPGAYLLGTDTLAAKIAGGVLLVVSIFSAGFLSNTSVQRIVGEQPQYLDEFEMQVRLRAMQSAYAAFTLLALLFLIYSAIASDTNLWVPRDYEGYNGVFWGVFLYAWVLPTAFAAFRLDEGEEEAK
jgi:hypothetical protein